MLPKRKFSEASEQNKIPILEVLSDAFNDCSSVLEIGSGSGQHAVYFAKHLKHLSWQPSDLAENLISIQAWIDEELLDNIFPPIELDVRLHPWQANKVDAIYTANTFHIMSWETIEDFFQGVGVLLKSQGKLLVYGPFSYHGKHTSPSNQQFDSHLKQRDPLSGVRDFVELDKLAQAQGLKCIEDFAMPANNRCLLWQNIK